MPFCTTGYLPQMDQPNESLPVTDPTVEDNVPRRSCKYRLIVEHSMKEAGESRWARWWLLLTTRILSSAMILGSGIVGYIAISRPVSPLSFAATLPFNFGPGLSFLFLTICTILHKKGSEKVTFPTLTLVIHAIFLVTSAYGFAHVMSTLIFNVPDYFSPENYPIGLHLIDVLVMQARIRLRFRYAFLGTVLRTVIDVIVFVSVPKKYFDGTIMVPFAPGSLIAYFAVKAGITLALGLFVIGLTRIPWCCCKEASPNTTTEDSPESKNSTEVE